MADLKVVEVDTRIVHLQLVTILVWLSGLGEPHVNFETTTMLVLLRVLEVLIELSCLVFCLSEEQSDTYILRFGILCAKAIAVILRRALTVLYVRRRPFQQQP